MPAVCTQDIALLQYYLPYISHPTHSWPPSPSSPPPLTSIGSSALFSQYCGGESSRIPRGAGWFVLTWLIFCWISIADIMNCLILTVWCFQSVVKVKGAVGQNHFENLHLLSTYYMCILLCFVSLHLCVFLLYMFQRCSPEKRMNHNPPK